MHSYKTVEPLSSRRCPTLAEIPTYRRNQAAVDTVRKRYRGKLPRGEYETLEHIARFTKNGHCFPGVPLLAAMADCSERTIQRRIRKLEKRGELEIRDCCGPALYHRTNRYTVLCLAPAGQPAPKRGDKMSPKIYSPSRSIPLPVPVLVPVKKNINSSNPTVGDRVTEKVSGGDSDQTVNDAPRDASRRPEAGREFTGGIGSGEGQAERDRLWTRILAVIQERTSRHIFETWYKPKAVRLIRTNATQVWIEVPNNWFLSYHQDNRELAIAAVRAVLPGVERVVWVLPPGEHR